MFNYSSYYKRIGFIVIFILLIMACVVAPIHNKKCYAEESLENELNENVEDILDDIDFSAIESEVSGDLIFGFSFLKMVKNILSGDLLSDYNSVYLFIKSTISEKIRENLRFFISLFIVVVLFEIFNSFSNDKQKEVKVSIRLIFSFLLAFAILMFVKTFFSNIKEIIDELFSFANVLFPILIGLLALSGATSSASVFSSFSVFLLETGSFIIKYVLLPLSLSIAILSVFSSVFSKGKFSKLTSLFRMCFKYTIIIFFSIFGTLSTVNIVSSASRDGLNVKLTKFAIKNYVPILGGYVSEGVDFLYTCSLLVKNAIGLCSIIVIIFKILLPLLSIFIISLLFKSLAVVSGFIGSGTFSDMFDDVSKSFGNFLSVLLGSFLIVFVFVFLIILAVGVV